MGIKQYSQLSGIYSVFLFIIFLRFDLIGSELYEKIIASILFGFFWPLFLLLLIIVSIEEFISGDLEAVGIGALYILLFFISKYLRNKYLGRNSQAISEEDLDEVGVDAEGYNPIDQGLSELFTSALEVSITKQIISEHEGELIEQINLKPLNLMIRLRNALKNTETRDIIILMFDAIKNWNDKDEDIMNVNQALRNFQESGWDIINWINKGVWFVFKIVVYIDKESNINEIRDCFDFKLLKHELNATTGMFLGSKHYIINDVDVTLLAYSLDRENETAWVRKGAFSFLEFQSPEPFKIKLKETAEQLIIKYNIVNS